MPLGLESTSCDIDNIVSHTNASVGQDNQNAVQLYFFGQVTVLALAWTSHDPDGIINGTTAFLRSRRLE